VSRPSRKRPDGGLEAEVLGVLWSAGEEALTPSEVNRRLDSGLAYTTVMTVLTRLWKKGLVDRVGQGRAFAYRPVVTESELATRRMREALDGVGDRASTLAGFVGSLSSRDVTHLRRLLDEMDDPK
jgi:predicted transcriptional regulator